MSLNNKQKPLCQMAATELYPKETKSKQTARKWQSSVWVWRLRLTPRRQRVSKQQENDKAAFGSDALD